MVTVKRSGEGPLQPLRRGTKIGKYRIEKVLAAGSFAHVYRAADTIEGIRVALKIPHMHLTDRKLLDSFKKEAQVAARLDHPNILTLKNASYIDDRFVIVYPLGECTLADRLESRLSTLRALNYSEQLLEGLAHASRLKVIHCDIKPENILFFPNDHLRITDFGIARVANRTITASGSGTVGYMAPEQAMGKPSFRSDVFSAGLVIYRMFSGILPEWPFKKPLTGQERLRARLHSDLIAVILRALEIDARKRFENAGQMLLAFRRVKHRALLHMARRRRRETSPEPLQEIRKRRFRRNHAAALEARHECPKCSGPISEYMEFCPWCSRKIRFERGLTRFPKSCPRCRRGLKLDWRFCPWCFGPAISEGIERRYRDVRYAANCTNENCHRKQLMPFMRYCPWCKRKVRKKWTVESGKPCSGCGWGVLGELWDYCPWCGRSTSA